MRTRRRMLELALLAGLGYGGAVAGLYALQDRLLFPRHATPAPTRALPHASAWTLRAADGVRLEGLRVPAAAAPATTVLGFAGNAWNAHDFAGFLHDCLPTADVVAFHYRGYPPSEGRPGERALGDDARRIVAAVRDRSPDRAVVLVGVSLGSGVAAHALAGSEATAAVLVTPFDSIRAIARRQYPWAPVGALLKHPFDTAARLAEVDRPTAVLYAGADTLIPPASTEMLMARLPRLVHRDLFPDAGHNSIYDMPRFPTALQAAVDAVRAAA